MLAKRILIVLLALSIAVLAFGCGGKKAIDHPTVAPAVTPPPVENPVEPPVHEKPVEPHNVTAPRLDDVFFAYDKYNLSGEARGSLESDARELQRRADVQIVIEGHCDERGTRTYNLALGEKRANAARDYLVSLGISGSRITVISYGKERPFDPGHNEVAWAKNRRAHFVVK